MATLTFDGQSLVLDGRRLWLVSGAIPYARVPRDQWADRIHLAKLAGLNTVDVAVVWARHEPRHGQFDFSGENDLRHFIELIQQAGLMCILRVGPYIDHGFDNGGLPPWLIESQTMRLRTNSQAFLEACSRFITALANQVRSLQAVAPSASRASREQASQQSGPIVLIQNEMGWSCGHDGLAASYLGELDRYYREAGFAVPVVNANDLWQSVEGEIDGWTGSGNMLAHLRQLAAIRPHQPRLVMDLQIGREDFFGKPVESSRSPSSMMRTLAEVLAAAGQYNISPFCGGTNFAFAAGRDHASIHRFPTTSHDCGAPVDEIGRPGALFEPIRRISTFASRFHRIFSHLEPSRASASLLPGASNHVQWKKEGRNASKPSNGSHSAQRGSVSVVHVQGSQGSVVFLFNDHQAVAEPGSNVHQLLLADGSTLPVDLGNLPVSWVLLDARLTGRSLIDYCNSAALAIVGKVFVCFGSAGSRAMLSINGSPLEALVPADDKPPFVHEHEGMTVVIASDKQVSQIYTDDSHVYLGVAGIDRSGRPIPLPDSKSCTVINAEGHVTTHKFAAHPHAARKSARITLSEWTCARTDEHFNGTSARYATIQGPADLVSLGASFGYGWYRITFPSSAAHKVHVAFPHSAHRLQVAFGGEFGGVVGVGPGAEPGVDLHLKKKEQTIVVLAENAGRVSNGADLGEKVGLFGDPWIVSPVKVSKPKVLPGEPIDLLKFKAPLWSVHESDTSDPQRLTWTIPHRSKTPIIMRIDEFDDAGSDSTGGSSGGGVGGGVVIVNDKPIRFFHSGGCEPILIDPDLLSRGNNQIQISMQLMTAAAAEALARAVSFENCEEKLCEKAEWAFAKWEMPSSDAFGKPSRGSATGPHAPTWWKATFTAPEDCPPLFFDASGLSKGQIYINNRHLGRYFVATHAGKSVPPQKIYHIPQSFFTPGEPTEIVVFDEHGFAPTKARVFASAEARTIED